MTDEAKIRNFEERIVYLEKMWALMLKATFIPNTSSNKKDVKKARNELAALNNDRDLEQRILPIPRLHSGCRERPGYQP